MPIYAFLVAGLASWFQPDPMYSGMRVCAMNIVPPSTRVEIINDDNHRRTDCVVVGSGPFVHGRIIDVSPEARDALGFDGVAPVRVYRIVGHIPNCTSTPTPLQCKTPPQACVLDLPKPVLLQCSPRTTPSP